MGRTGSSSTLWPRCYNGSSRPEFSPRKDPSVTTIPGRLTPSLAPSVYPSTNDIRWAAGFYEGEGTCMFIERRPGAGSERAAIVQVNQWPLIWMRERFGGSICGTRGRNWKQWQIYGARARGFLQTIYILVSPRRQEQIRKALQVGKFSG